eukprot:TRINITY_DN14227_c1_g1_i1.p1 TRINITY_DN14227_c1_g1~~TRINITY_DN14227_c1_g1_i1.p1  ORF type:complete len:776 (+),score=108.21 TRINITY_DN14227_c1_g1_i1:35-2362(+)
MAWHQWSPRYGSQRWHDNSWSQQSWPQNSWQQGGYKRWQPTPAPAPGKVHSACKREPATIAAKGVEPKRRRAAAPVWEVLPEIHTGQLREALTKSIECLRSDPEIKDECKQEASQESDGVSFSDLHLEFKKAIEAILQSCQPANSKIHVGLMDYMGESHEEYRRDLDFLETTNTWFDSDSRHRRKVHYLPDECGWQEPSLYEDLAARVEDGFRLVLKVSHVATHLCKLERPQEWWPALWDQKYSRCASGVVAFLWQFPPSFRFQASFFDRLRHLFEYLSQDTRWAGLRHIVDFRHGSWYNEEVYTLLREKQVCLAWLHLQNTGWAADLPSGWTPTEQTTDFTFIRLFGNEDRCTGFYDRDFLQKLYMMCPKDAQSYVLFGNKATIADPEPVVKPCSLNARDFRAIFSTVDLVARIGWILNRGRCPRKLKPEEVEIVSTFLLRFSEKARQHRVQLQMSVWVVANGKTEKRLFEWRPLEQDSFQIDLYDARVQDDVAVVVRQITGMEDVDVIESLCNSGPRQLEDAEAKIVNATFIRFSSRAREAGVLQTTAVEVAHGLDGSLVYRWKATNDGKTSESLRSFGDDGKQLIELSPMDLREDLAKEHDVLLSLRELKFGRVQREADPEPETGAKPEVPRRRNRATPHVAATVPLSQLVTMKSELKEEVQPSVDTAPKEEVKEEVKDAAETSVSQASPPHPGKATSWDPATGQMYEEDLPDEILQMMHGSMSQDSSVKADASVVSGDSHGATSLDFASVVANAKSIMAEYSKFFGLQAAY